MAPPKRSIHQYSENAIQNAMKAIRDGVAIRKSSRIYGVPRGTLQDRIHGRVKEGPRQMGPKSFLTKSEEEEIVRWLIDLAKCGFPRKKEELLDSVQKIVSDSKRRSSFKNGRPGEKWYKVFLNRHPAIALREPEGVTKGRSCITEEYIRKWFSNLHDYLQEIDAEDVMTDPTRILNGDETGFALCRKSGKILAPKGWKNIYEVKKSGEKETLTVLMVFSANGGIIPPMVVYPYIRPPKVVIQNMPEKWFLGRSETGWMRSDIFFEYIANNVNVWIDEQNITRPVILFIDGHKSHLTKEISEFCHSNKIILYALPPNTTHIMQPADVSVFKPLKSKWKHTVRQWLNKEDNSNSSVTKINFAPLLQDVVKDPTLISSIKNGFRKCGLFPFDPNLVDYSKCIKNYHEKLLDNSNVTHISNEKLKITIEVLLAMKPQLDENANINEVLSKLNGIQTESEGTETISTYDIEEDDTLKETESPNFDKPDAINLDSTEFIYLDDLDNNNVSLLDVSDALIHPESEEREILEIPEAKEKSENEKENKDLNRSNKVKIVSDIIIKAGKENEGKEKTDSIIDNKKSPFMQHLFFPNPINKANKRKNTAAQNMPAAISSETYRAFLQQKEDQKQEKELQKAERRKKDVLVILVK